MQCHDDHLQWEKYPVINQVFCTINQDKTVLIYFHTFAWFCICFKSACNENTKFLKNYSSIFVNAQNHKCIFRLHVLMIKLL